MGAIDQEPTRKSPNTLAGAQARARARTDERGATRPTAIYPGLQDNPQASDVRSPATSGSRPPAASGSRLPARSGSHLPAPISAPLDGDHAPVILPGRSIVPTTTSVIPRHTGRPAINRTLRFAAALICIAAVVTTALLYNTMRTSTPKGENLASTVPGPSGRGPLTAQVGIIVAAPVPQAVHSSQAVVAQTAVLTSGGSVTAYGLASLQPCQSSVMFVPNINQWTVPPGCYANIYVPNPANYVSRPGFGFCNWWVRVTHPKTPDITEGYYPRGTTPVAGAAIFFDPYEQGAGSIGHWAQAVAVSSDGYWVLISEMNFAWRGAGWAKIDYRYIHVSPHVHFVYGV
ncbi:MAG: hypothetical protein KGO05_07195 [Chloroflexota bacterium]|nr:hypothetical protein [Chloroflexota bacterium]